MALLKRSALRQSRAQDGEPSMTTHAVKLKVSANIPTDCSFWLEDDGWNGVCEELSITVRRLRSSHRLRAKNCNRWGCLPIPLASPHGLSLRVLHPGLSAGEGHFSSTMPFYLRAERLPTSKKNVPTHGSVLRPTISHWMCSVSRLSSEAPILGEKLPLQSLWERHPGPGSMSVIAC